MAQGLGSDPEHPSPEMAEGEKDELFSIPAAFNTWKVLKFYICYLESLKSIVKLHSRAPS